MNGEIEEYKLREKMQLIASRLAGLPYKYGSDGIDDFDCSGFALHLLRHAGFNLPDMTANGIRKYFKGCEIYRYKVKIGDLYFYGKPRINHVMVCYRVWDRSKNYRMLIGACSGTSKTRKLRDAWKQNAYIKVVKDTYWLKNLNCIVDPFLKTDD